MAQNAVTANPFAGLANVPGGRQMLLLVGLSLSIAIGVTAAFWLREPSYELLYSNLSDRDVAEVMDALRAEATPYRLDNGSLLVPSKDVYNARLRLSSQGLPRGAGFGLEIIEGESTFSTSQFMENARYHHALETELARTISNLQPVQGARVHLAMPKPTVFLRKNDKPSASVFLDLFPGRVLEEPQVNSIVHLVASSIPQLESSRVTVVDQRGSLLNSPIETIRTGSGYFSPNKLIAPEARASSSGTVSQRMLLSALIWSSTSVVICATRSAATGSRLVKSNRSQSSVTLEPCCWACLPRFFCSA